MKRGDVAAVKRAQAAGVPVADLADPWGWPLLHVAALHGKSALVRLLWEADRGKDRRRLRRGLGFALQSDDRQTIQYFLEQGAATTGLMKALYLRDDSQLRAFLATDPAQASQRDEDGQTPLHVVANMNLRETAALLIDAGAEIDARNQLGETPFFRAISNRAESVARLLLARGADINTITANGQNALHCAATTHSKKLVALLEARGIDPAFQDIHVASALGRIEQVKALLASEPGLRDRRDPLGATALYWSTAHKQLEVVEHLLAAGADPNLAEHQGRTPLLCAQQRKDRRLVELLVRHGAIAR